MNLEQPLLELPSTWCNSQRLKSHSLRFYLPFNDVADLGPLNGLEFLEAPLLAVLLLYMLQAALTLLGTIPFCLQAPVVVSICGQLLSKPARMIIHFALELSS